MLQVPEVKMAKLFGGMTFIKLPKLKMPGVLTLGGMEEVPSYDIIVAKDSSGHTDSIAEAINMLPADGGSILIKEGEYQLTGQITLAKGNVRIIGTGKSTKIIQADNCLVMYCTGSNVRIESIYFYGSGVGTEYGIHLRECHYCEIRGCIFENFTMRPIVMSFAEREDAYHIIMGNTLVSNAGGIQATNANSVRIQDNYVYDCSDGRGISVNSDDSHILDNTCIGNNEEGIYCAAADRTKITGNLCLDNVENGIYMVSCDDCLLSNNVCSGNDANDTATYHGIHLDTNCDNCLITNNRCLNNDGYEINIGDASDDNNAVTFNICNGTDHEGAINDSGTGTQIGHNITS